MEDWENCEEKGLKRSASSTQLIGPTPSVHTSLTPPFPSISHKYVRSVTFFTFFFSPFFLPLAQLYLFPYPTSTQLTHSLTSTTTCLPTRSTVRRYPREWTLHNFRLRLGLAFTHTSPVPLSYELDTCRRNCRRDAGKNTTQQCVLKVLFNEMKMHERLTIIPHFISSLALNRVMK